MNITAFTNNFIYIYSMNPILPEYVAYPPAVKLCVLYLICLLLQGFDIIEHYVTYNNNRSSNVFASAFYLGDMWCDQAVGHALTVGGPGSSIPPVGGRSSPPGLSST